MSLSCSSKDSHDVEARGSSPRTEKLARHSTTNGHSAPSSSAAPLRKSSSMSELKRVSSLAAVTAASEGRKAADAASKAAAEEKKRIGECVLHAFNGGLTCVRSGGGAQEKA